jgi:hypothetical protein
MKRTHKRIGTPAAVAIAQPRREPKTVVVVGSGRGGTSAIAGSIHLLGIRMMEDEGSLNSEDSEIVRAYQRKRPGGHQAAAREVARIIEERNAAHDVWGWKDPSADLYLESVINHVRNPHFVFVLRNLLDVALSHVATRTGTLEVGFDSALKRYARYWDILQKLHCPTLMVSYERAVLDRNAFVKEVSNFLGIKPSRSQAKSARDFLDPAGGYRPTRS